MPAEQITHFNDGCWGLWMITEDQPSLQREISGEPVPDNLTNEQKRLEFLAGRALVRKLLAEWNLPYRGLVKDSYGKPFLEGLQIHVSLSHSYPFVAAVLHRQKNVGIDLEQPKDKLLRIGPRILSRTEFEDAGSNVVKHCVYWCAKETLIKIHGKKDLTFARNLLISPFSLAKEGHLIGRILANDTETAIPLEYHVSESFVVVISK